LDIKKENSIIKKSAVFISKWRSLPVYELISYFFMFACVPMLAYGIESYNYEIIKIIILAVLTMYSGFFATLIWNDITDVDIDLIAHPDRPIPSGRINSKKFFKIALIFSAFTFIFSILISIWCFVIVGINALFVALHNKYLKRKVKFPAYSEIFGPFQWIVIVILGFFSIWTTTPITSEISINFPFFGNIFTNNKAIEQMILLIIFTYFADSSHDIAEGIHDAEADLTHGVKTYATTFGKENAAKISIILFIISGISGVVMFLRSILSPIFLCIFLFLFLYTLIYPIKLLKSNKQDIEKQGLVVGRRLYDYFLFTYDILFIGLVIQILIF
jgi:geranylgeranylglycerol-phosphate geranylgeranyltransferase